MKVAHPVIAFIAVVLISCTSHAASFSFTEAFLDASTLQSSSNGGTIDTGSGVLAPSHADGTPMGADVGFTGDVIGTFGATEFHRIGQSGLTILVGAGDTLGATVYNDNDDVWSTGVWVETAADGIVDSAVVALNPGDSTDVSLSLATITGPIIAMGVKVQGVFTAGSNPSAGDKYHISVVPEPSAFVGLCSLGLAFVIRRRTKNKRRAF